ncbi:MAG: methionyl-tRNA formyltransferase [Armatimonadetes bacterium]|nr:methionyl-tRNA formyltransferase [Armatimonadota bacterium]
MKVVFFGTGEFAVPALRRISDHVVLAVSQPDRPSGRGLKVKASPFKEAAIELGLDVATPEKCKEPDFIARIEALSPDVLLVAAYGQIMPMRLFDCARRGGINLHGSILPKLRGAAPIQRAILDGEPETGVTLMQMDKGMDTGDIIAIERTPIGADETYTELQDRLSHIAAGMAAGFLPRICEGNYPRVPQTPDLATYAPMVTKAEAELSFERSASHEYNRFRAFTDRPGAWARTRFGNVRVRQARWSPCRAPAGSILAVQPSLRVAFADGGMEWIEVQAEGKRPMSGRDFANGQRLKAGDSLLADA